jgi:Cdc6-like AAA superfamily ATPase
MTLMQKFGGWFGKKPEPDADLRQAPASVSTMAQQMRTGTAAQPAAAAGQYPRFRVNANDHINVRASDILGRTRIKLLEAFTPSQPVSDRRRFSGRVDLLTSLIRAIEEQRLHTVLYGARGLGKTSVLHVLAQAAQEARYLVVYVSCGADSSFDEVFRTIAAGIPMLFHSTVGPTSPEVEQGKTLADILPETPISVRVASDMLAKIVGTRVVVILDEFDRSESPIFRRNIAELIKNLSDRMIRVQLVIAGVAANLVQLLEHIPSIQRNIFPLQIPWMTTTEVKLLIKNGEDLCGLRFDDTAVRAVSVAAHGSPYLASLLSHHAGLIALDADRTSVGIADAMEAILVAVREFKGRLSSRAKMLLWQLVRDGQIRALGTLAGTALVSGGTFRRDDLRASMASLDSIQRCEELIPGLVASEVLVQREQEDVKTYNFSEESVAPYLWLLWMATHLRDGKTADMAQGVLLQTASAE